MRPFILQSTLFIIAQGRQPELPNENNPRIRNKACDMWANPPLYTPPQISDYILTPAGNRKYFGAHVTPAGLKIMEAAIYWSKQQFTSWDNIKRFAIGSKCSTNTSIVFARSGMSRSYLSDAVFTQFNALRRGEAANERWKHFPAQTFNAGELWPPTPQKTAPFLKALANFYGGWIPLGTAVFACATAECNKFGKFEHAGIITHITASFQKKNAVIYYIFNNNWLRTENDDNGRCFDVPSESYGLGSMGNWMLDRRFYPSEKGKIATAQWRPLPFFEVTYDERGIPVEVMPMMPFEFDTFHPWNGAHAHFIVPIEVHRQIKKTATTPLSSFEMAEGPMRGLQSV